MLRPVVPDGKPTYPAGTSQYIIDRAASIRRKKQRIVALRSKPSINDNIEEQAGQGQPMRFDTVSEYEYSFSSKSTSPSNPSSLPEEDETGSVDEAADILPPRERQTPHSSLDGTTSQGFGSPQVSLRPLKIPIDEEETVVDAAAKREGSSTDSVGDVDKKQTGRPQSRRDHRNIESLPPLSDQGGDIDVLVVTWNLGNEPVDPNELKLWLPVETAKHQLVVVGAQESWHKQDKMSRKKMKDEARGFREGVWDEDRYSQSDVKASSRKSTFGKLRDAKEKRKLLSRDRFKRQVQLHCGTAYRKIASVQLLEMSLLVLARTDIRGRVGDIRKYRKATGIGNVIGNKGGLAVSMTIDGMSICFLSCHLAAHEQERKVLARNGDVFDIFRAVSAEARPPKFDLSLTHDCTIVMGDLNYRINLGIADGRQREQPAQFAEVLNLIHRKDYATLLSADQLRREMKGRKVFANFQEETIRFDPTFKVVKGVAASEYKDSRTPSFCDRILWTALPHMMARVRQKNYSSNVHVTTSDHKPVCCEFHIVPPPRPEASTFRKRGTNNKKPARMKRSKGYQAASFRNLRQPSMMRLGLRHRVELRLFINKVRLTKPLDRPRITIWCGAHAMREFATTEPTLTTARTRAGLRRSQYVAEHCNWAPLHIVLRSSRAALGKRYLVVAVWAFTEATKGKGKLKRSCVGQCIISLAPLAAKSTYSWEASATNYGQDAGYIDGRLSVYSDSVDSSTTVIGSLLNLSFKGLSFRNSRRRESSGAATDAANRHATLADTIAEEEPCLEDDESESDGSREAWEYTRGSGDGAPQAEHALDWDTKDTNEPHGDPVAQDASNEKDGSVADGDEGHIPSSKQQELLRNASRTMQPVGIDE